MKSFRKLVSFLLALMLVLGTMGTVAFAEEPVTITLLTTRQTAGTNDINDLWFFKYLEDKFNVKFELEQTFQDGAIQRLALMWGSADLPDIIWGMQIGTNEILQWGQEEGLLLDWTPYLNAEKMPNAYQTMQDFPDAFTASTTPDGKIYTMPYVKGSKYYDNTGAFSRSVRVYINTDWMEKCGIEKMPATLDETLEVLRTFKAKDPKGLGENIMPLVETGDKMKDWVWHSLGFFGHTGTQQYGTAFSIKNGNVVLPCYSEEAREFLTFWNAMYTEGLFSPDTFTTDKATRRGWLSSGYAGMMADDTIQYSESEWANWVGLPLVTSDFCDKPVAAMNRSYTVAGTYVSAEAKNVDKIVEIIDYMYSDEGATYYTYGPAKGSELETKYGNTWEGWYYTDPVDNSTLTCDPVQRGEVNGQATYVDKMISPCYYIAGRFDHTGDYITKLAGRESTMEYPETIDAVNGKTLISYAASKPDMSIWQGHWNTTQVEAMQGKLTGIILPDVYLTPDEVTTVADIESVFTNYVKAESAKFITGERPLSEFDAYQAELKGMGIEEYIEIYAKAYENFLNANFAK